MDLLKKREAHGTFKRRTFIFKTKMKFCKVCVKFHELHMVTMDYLVKIIACTELAKLKFFYSKVPGGLSTSPKRKTFGQETRRDF